MEISLEKLTSLVNEVYDRGMVGCADLRQQDIEELFQKFHISDSGGFKVWKIDDLKKLPEGTIFQHLLKGRCWIVCRSNGTKYMQFDKGQAIDFLSDQDPWDKPMRLVHNV